MATCHSIIYYVWLPVKELFTDTCHRIIYDYLSQNYLWLPVTELFMTTCHRIIYCFLLQSYLRLPVTELFMTTCHSCHQFYSPCSAHISQFPGCRSQTGQYMYNTLLCVRSKGNQTYNLKVPGSIPAPIKLILGPSRIIFMKSKDILVHQTDKNLL